MTRVIESIRQFFGKLIEPHKGITDPRMRRTASVLAGLMLALVVITTIPGVLYYANTGRLTVDSLVGELAFIVVYGLSRSRWPRAATGLLVAALTLIILARLPSSEQMALASLWAAFPILLSAILLSAWPTVGVALINVVAVAFIMLIARTVTINDLTTALTLNVFFGLIIVVTKFARDRDVDRLDRQAKLLSEVNQSLTIAKERAEKADQVKSQFLASMSHELRTPLNAILNFTKVLRKGVLGPVNERQVETLNEVIYSGQHLLALINDILDISKIQSGALALFVEDNIDLEAILSSGTSTVGSLIKDKPVTLLKDIDANLPPILCDQRRVQQVLLNLLSNAAKFTDEGTITLRARCQGDHILFAVVDTGAGIPQDQHDRIFEPFIQTETGIKHAGGTGLGLPISKSLVEAHGGKIWLESTPGEGSAFMFSLPIESPHLREQMKASMELAHA
jgi:signal transduction histidine kinase